MVNYAAIAASIFPNVGGWAGGILTAKNIQPWYESLVKPSWRPPNWAFGPVWTALYSSMGYASYLVYSDGGGLDGRARLPLILYGTQLALNWAWTPIFFHWKKMGWALVDIVGLYGVVVACTAAFYEINPTAGLLMVPYVLWLTLATALNYTVWRDNSDTKSD